MLWYVKFFRDPVACLGEMYRRCGPVMALGSVLPWGRGQLLGFALGPEMNRQVLGDANLFRTSGQTWRGPRASALRRIRCGLTRMNGDQHRQQRQLLTPRFVSRAVEGYAADMAAVTGQHLAAWRPGQTLDLWQQMRSLALRIATHVLFGREGPSRADALEELIRELLTRTFSAGVWMFPVSLPGTPYRRLLQCAEQIERHLQAMIEERRSRPPGPTDLLHLLVWAHDVGFGQMTDADLLGQATVLFAGSYENVTNALTWTIFLLAQHPRLMAELHDELHRTLGGAPPAADQLGRLPLLDAVIRESMRVLPPVPYLLRVAMRPVDLGGVSLREGDRVVCSPYVTHHLPQLFPEPERFHPQRWFAIKPDAYEYLPFGAGSRACIGYDFAMTEIKVVLAMILQRWRLTVVPGTRIDRSVAVTMGPKHGLPVSIHEQDQDFQAVPVHGDIHDMVDLTHRALHPARPLAPAA